MISLKKVFIWNRSERMNSIEDKYLGSLLGVAIGDAMGWPQERSQTKNKSARSTDFQKWVRRSGYGHTYTEEIIQKGSYSDDTQLTLATARALNYRNFLSYFGRSELPSWLLYERGGGGATKRAARSWSNGKPPWKQNKSAIQSYFEAGGNGVVMRVISHAYEKNISSEEMNQKIFLNGISTHGHPRAILSALVYGKAAEYLITNNKQMKYGELVDYLINKKEEWSKFPVPNNINDWLNASFSIGINYQKLWEQTGEELFDGLTLIKETLANGLFDQTSETLSKLDCNNPKVKGSGVVTCLTAIYIVSKFSIDPQNGLLEIAFFEGSDTDTNAAATGGLLGAIHGTRWIKSEWLGVQDVEYITQLAKTIPEATIPERRDMWNFSESKNLIKELHGNDRKKKSVKLGPFDNLTVVDKYPIRSQKNKEVFVLKNEESQTFYCKLQKPVFKNEDTELRRSELFDLELSPEQIIELQNTLPQRITLEKFTSLLSETIRMLRNKPLDIFGELDVEQIENEVRKKCSYKKEIRLFVEKVYRYYFE